MDSGDACFNGLAKIDDMMRLFVGSFTNSVNSLIKLNQQQVDNTRLDSFLADLKPVKSQLSEHFTRLLSVDHKKESFDLDECAQQLIADIKQLDAIKTDDLPSRYSDSVQKSLSKSSEHFKTLLKTAYVTYINVYRHTTMHSRKLMQDPVMKFFSQIPIDDVQLVELFNSLKFSSRSALDSLDKQYYACLFGEDYEANPFFYMQDFECIQKSSVYSAHFVDLCFAAQALSTHLLDVANCMIANKSCFKQCEFDALVLAIDDFECLANSKHELSSQLTSFNVEFKYVAVTTSYSAFLWLLCNQHPNMCTQLQEKSAFEQMFTFARKIFTSLSRVVSQNIVAAFENCLRVNLSQDHESSEFDSEAVASSSSDSSSAKQVEIDFMMAK